MGSPLVRVSAIDAVHQRLCDALERGEFVPGERLPSESSLAARFGVSRSAIREALRMLSAVGLTQTRNGVGTFVVSTEVAPALQFGGFSAGELLEARRYLEVPSASLAAARAGAAEVAELRAVLSLMAGEVDDEEWVALDLRFHSLIARAANNEVFVYVLKQLRETLSLQSRFANSVGDRRASSNAEHERIVAAIEARDAAAAASAMTEHLDHVQSALASLSPRFHRLRSG